MIHWSLKAAGIRSCCQPRSDFKMKWTCSFPRVVDRRTDFQVRLGKDHPYSPNLCSKTAGPGLFFHPSSFFLSLTPAEQELSQLHEMDTPPPTTIPDSLLLSQAYMINESLDGTWMIAGWLWEPTWGISQDICLWEILRFLCWWYFLGHTLNLRER